MKTFIFTFLLTSLTFSQSSVIRINQLGYLEKSIKAAVLLSKDNLTIKTFELIDAQSGNSVFKGEADSFGKYGNFESTFRLNFSEYEIPGTYYVKAGDTQSPEFNISDK